MTAAWIYDESEQPPKPRILRLRPRRSFIEKLARSLSLRTIRRLRIKLRACRSFYREVELSWQDDLAKQESLVAALNARIASMAADAASDAKHRESMEHEADRSAKLTERANARIKELEVELAVSRRECELLAAVVERDHKRIEAETRMNCHIIEDYDGTAKRGMSVARDE